MSENMTFKSDASFLYLLHPDESLCVITTPAGVKGFIAFLTREEAILIIAASKWPQRKLGYKIPAGKLLEKYPDMAIHVMSYASTDSVDIQTVTKDDLV